MSATAPAGDWLQLAEAALPLVDTPAALLDGAQQVLALAPHPDDESLGCGGLLAACAAAGLAVRVVIVSDGAGSHAGSRQYPPARLAALRQQEARAAVAALGLDAAHDLHFLGLPDGAVPRQGEAFAAALARLAGLAGDVPCCLLATWRHDPHGDHAATAALAAALLPLLPGGSHALFYPVWGIGFAHAVPGFPMPPAPALPLPPRGFRLDVRAQLAAKRRAIAAHASQMTALIDDVPGGFRVPVELLALMTRDSELYLREPGL